MVSLDALVQALGQIVYDWRPASDELSWGGDYARILGYDERAMGNTTSSWTDRVHPDDLARVMAEVEACTRQQRFYDLEYRFRRSDGAYLWMHDRGVPFLGADGGLERIVGVFSDISDRKRAQQALRELTRRMVEKIFATALEDWPALLRAARETGEEFRRGKYGTTPVSIAAAQN